jgi:hypothetical protein
VPESRERKAAVAKNKRKAQPQTASPRRAAGSGSGGMVSYYIAGQYIPFMTELGNWNILIGMGGMAAAFGLATLWK